MQVVLPPDSNWKRPIAQSVHAVCPVDGVDFPGGQSMQLVDEAAAFVLEDVPVGQSIHREADAWPASVPIVPAGQAMQESVELEPVSSL